MLDVGILCARPDVGLAAIVVSDESGGAYTTINSCGHSATTIDQANLDLDGEAGLRVGCLLALCPRKYCTFHNAHLVLGRFFEFEPTSRDVGWNTKYHGKRLRPFLWRCYDSDLGCRIGGARFKSDSFEARKPLMRPLYRRVGSATRSNRLGTQAVTEWRFALFLPYWHVDS